MRGDVGGGGSGDGGVRDDGGAFGRGEVLWATKKSGCGHGEGL